MFITPEQQLIVNSMSLGHNRACCSGDHFCDKCRQQKQATRNNSAPLVPPASLSANNVSPGLLEHIKQEIQTTPKVCGLPMAERPESQQPKPVRYLSHNTTNDQDSGPGVLVPPTCSFTPVGD
jgi:hypothetical protein